MSTPMEAWPQRHRITADEYCRMAEVGLLAPEARVELAPLDTVCSGHRSAREIRSQQ
jgi:hypothetical protein